jgi:hypothetical protein
LGLSKSCAETTVDAESYSHSCSHNFEWIKFAFVKLKKAFDQLHSDLSSASAANTWGLASFAINFACLSQGSSSDSNSVYLASSCASPEAFLEGKKASLQKAEAPRWWEGPCSLAECYSWLQRYCASSGNPLPMYECWQCLHPSSYRRAYNLRHPGCAFLLPDCFGCALITCCSFLH